MVENDLNVVLVNFFVVRGVRSVKRFDVKEDETFNMARGFEYVPGYALGDLALYMGCVNVWTSYWI